MGGGSIGVHLGLGGPVPSLADLVRGDVLAGGDHQGGGAQLEGSQGGEDGAEAGGGGCADDGEVDVEAGDDRRDEPVPEANQDGGHEEDRELEAVHAEALTLTIIIVIIIIMFILRLSF